MTLPASRFVVTPLLDFVKLIRRYVKYLHAVKDLARQLTVTTVQKDAVSRVSQRVINARMRGHILLRKAIQVDIAHDSEHRINNLDAVQVLRREVVEHVEPIIDDDRSRVNRRLRKWKGLRESWLFFDILSRQLSPRLVHEHHLPKVLFGFLKLEKIIARNRVLLLDVIVFRRTKDVYAVLVIFEGADQIRVDCFVGG